VEAGTAGPHEANGRFHSQPAGGNPTDCRPPQSRACSLNGHGRGKDPSTTPIDWSGPACRKRHSLLCGPAFGSHWLRFELGLRASGPPLCCMHGAAGSLA
jgi:hypothetical protein